MPGVLTGVRGRVLRAPVACDSESNLHGRQALLWLGEEEAQGG